VDQEERQHRGQGIDYELPGVDARDEQDRRQPEHDDHHRAVKKTPWLTNREAASAKRSKRFTGCFCSSRGAVADAHTQKRIAYPVAADDRRS
jgi:hypothetical protein